MTAGERHERSGTGRDPRGAGVRASPVTRPYGTWRRRFPGADLWLVDGLATAWGAWQDDTGASVWVRVAARR